MTDPTGTDTGTPNGDHGPTSQALFDQARAAVAALRKAGARDRDPSGRMLPGNVAQLRHGLRCNRLLDVPDIAAWHREQVAAISTDLGGAAELTALARASVREVARLEVLLAALGQELLESGVLTGKGKMRAATTTYLQVLDRFTRLAGTLGFERRARQLNVAEELARLHEAPK